MMCDDRKMKNHTRVTEFLILGFSEFQDLQLPLFTVFLLIYLMAILGNLLIICIICADQELHIPMYFFLANLSILDISSLTITLPKLLSIFLTQNNAISLTECFLQMYCFMASVGVEFWLLTAMAYDRYVAICNPLRYTIIMNKGVSTLLAAASWIGGLLEILPHTLVVSQFSYCDSNVINHFFCDITALLELSCSDTSLLNAMTYIDSVFLTFTPFLLTLTSYVFIISTVLEIRSTEGKSKAFSTCSSHLIVIVFLYGTILAVYMQHRSGDSAKSNKLFTAMYVVTPPLLNPLIYSLRNKDLKVSLKKAITSTLIPSATKHF